MQYVIRLAFVGDAYSAIFLKLLLSKIKKIPCNFCQKINEKNRGIMDVPKHSALLSSLKLDHFSRDNKVMCIEEMNNADGSFILSSIIRDGVDQNQKIILILCHNSIGHFHSIGQKLGYNLMSLKDSGQIFVVDIMEEMVNRGFLLASDPLKSVYCDIKKFIDENNNEDCNAEERGVCIVIENISNLLLAQIKNVFFFVQYLRQIIFKRKNSKMVCSYHSFRNSWNENVLSGQLKHVSDIVVTLTDLKTGRANDITGHMTIMMEDENFIRNTSQYHYLLQDKTIKVFAPGTNDFCTR